MQIPQISDQAGVVTSFATDDVEELEQAHLRKNRRYTQLHPGRFRAEILNAQLGSVQLCRERLSVGMKLTAAPDKRFIPLGMILENAGDLQFCGRTPAVTPIYHAAGGQWELSFKQPLDYIFLAFDRESFFTNVEHLTSQPVPNSWLVSESRNAPSEKLQELGRCLNQTLSRLNDNSSLLSSFAAIKSLESEILRKSVATLYSAQPGKPTKFSLTARERGVNRVLEYLDAQPGQVPTMLDMCRISGISERSLQTAFHVRFELTPIQYLRAYRLDCAHRELREATASDTTVARIASQWGFSELGRFAGEYRRLFGELPSVTLASS